MTVIAAIRIPGEGAVIAADGRVTAHDEILSDTCIKSVTAGSVMIAVSGQDGGLLNRLSLGRNWSDVCTIAAEYTKGTQLNWDAIAYDRKADEILYLDSDGSNFPVEKLYATTGSGGAYALGFMNAHPKAKDLTEAINLCRNAIRATIKRNASCGGKIRLLVARGRRAAIELY